MIDQAVPAEPPTAPPAPHMHSNFIHEKGVPLQDPRCDRKRRPHRFIVFVAAIAAVNKDILLSAASPAAATSSKVVMTTSSKVVTITAASAGDKA